MGGSFQYYSWLLYFCCGLVVFLLGFYILSFIFILLWLFLELIWPFVLGVLFPVLGYCNFCSYLRWVRFFSLVWPWLWVCWFNFPFLRLIFIFSSVISCIFAMNLNILCFLMWLFLVIHSFFCFLNGCYLKDYLFVLVFLTVHQVVVG